ncbi:MAG: hypothetical protein Ta2G_12560 [Termitinemataceae bacterium]|nr:MAG: hypothetical protein Ta2G_12560 [Termitinemataceae bacterium]
MGMLFSPDAGSREVYQQIKGVDYFDTVWENIKKYHENTTKNLTVKFILQPQNLNDIYNIVNKCVECKVRQVSLDFEIYSAQRKDDIKSFVQPLRTLNALLIQNGIKVAKGSFMPPELWAKATNTQLTAPRDPTEKRTVFDGCAINLAEHCNLNCVGCSVFSPLATKEFLDIDVFTRDMKRLGELSSCDSPLINLQGGEPLLHPQKELFFEQARKHFPYSHKHTMAEILEFLAKPIPFCRYCDVPLRAARGNVPWTVSKREISEWT